MTNQLVHHTRIEGTGLLTFALKQRETHENYAHIDLSIYIQNHLKKVTVYLVVDSIQIGNRPQSPRTTALQALNPTHI